jgi:hypothetical protein
MSHRQTAATSGETFLPDLPDVSTYATNPQVIVCDDEFLLERQQSYEGWTFPPYHEPFTHIFGGLSTDTGNPIEVLQVLWRFVRPRTYEIDYVQLAILFNILGVSPDFLRHDVNIAGGPQVFTILTTPATVNTPILSDVPIVFVALHEILTGLLDFWIYMRRNNPNHPSARDVLAFSDWRVFLNSVNGLVTSAPWPLIFKRYIIRAINLQTIRNVLDVITPDNLMVAFDRPQQVQPYPLPTHFRTLYNWIKQYEVRSVSEYNGHHDTNHMILNILDELRYANRLPPIYKTFGFEWLHTVFYKAAKASEALHFLRYPLGSEAKADDLTRQTQDLLLRNVLQTFERYLAPPVGNCLTLQFMYGEFMLPFVTKLFQEMLQHPFIEPHSILIRHEDNYVVDISTWVGNLGYRTSCTLWTETRCLSDVITIILKFIYPHPDAHFVLNDTFLQGSNAQEIEALRVEIWMSELLGNLELKTDFVLQKVLQLEQYIELLGLIKEIGEIYNILFRSRVRNGRLHNLLSYFETQGRLATDPHNEFDVSKFPAIPWESFNDFISAIESETIFSSAFAQHLAEKQTFFLQHSEFKHMWLDTGKFTEIPNLVKGWTYVTFHIAFALFPFFCNMTSRGTCYYTVPRNDPLQVASESRIIEKSEKAQQTEFGVDPQRDDIRQPGGEVLTKVWVVKDGEHVQVIARPIPTRNETLHLRLHPTRAEFGYDYEYEKEEDTVVVTTQDPPPDGEI